MSLPTAPGPALNDGDDIFAHIVRHGRALIAPVEIANWLCLSAREIYYLADEGELEKHTMGTQGGAVRITRRSLILYLLKTANYKPRDEEHYLMIVGMLLGDMTDLGIKHAQWNAAQLLAKREHTRRVRGTRGDAETPPELPL